jgi:glutathione S-transferase
MHPTRSERSSSELSSKLGDRHYDDNEQKTSHQQVRFITNQRCPFAQKAWIALEASSTPYEMIEVSLYGAGGKPDWFWKLNPQGTVPIVAISNRSIGGGGEDDAVFADSELILDAIGAGKIVGGGTKDSMLLVDELSEDEKSRSDQWRQLISKQLVPVGKSAVLGGSVSKLRSLLKYLNSQVVGPYLVGEKLTLADCAAFPFLWRIDQEFGIGGNGNDGEEKLRQWIDKCMETEAFRRTILARGWWWWW